MPVLLFDRSVELEQSPAERGGEFAVQNVAHVPRAEPEVESLRAPAVELAACGCAGTHFDKRGNFHSRCPLRHGDRLGDSLLAAARRNLCAVQNDRVFSVESAFRNHFDAAAVGLRRVEPAVRFAVFAFGKAAVPDCGFGLQTEQRVVAAFFEGERLYAAEAFLPAGFARTRDLDFKSEHSAVHGMEISGE